MSTVEQTQTGVLEMHPKGYGFLRDPKRNFKPGVNDVYVGSPMLTKFGLKQGVRLTGKVEAASGKDGPKLTELVEIEGRSPEIYANLAGFD
jgi:transcription termination factor Rho